MEWILIVSACKFEAEVKESFRVVLGVSLDFVVSQCAECASWSRFIILRDDPVIVFRAWLELLQLHPTSAVRIEAGDSFDGWAIPFSVLEPCLNCELSRLRSANPDSHGIRARAPEHGAVCNTKISTGTESKDQREQQANSGGKQHVREHGHKRVA